MTERHRESYRVAYYHQSEPGSRGTTEEMDLANAESEASRLRLEGYTTQIINAEDEEPEDAIDL